MTHPTADSPHFFRAEHRGWNLQAQWLASMSTGSQGWVCIATRPTSSQGLNLGRWTTSELALEHGRAWVDRQVDSPTSLARRPPVVKRRQ